MSGELRVSGLESGLTITAQLYNASGEYGSVISCPEVYDSGIYEGDMAGPADTYDVVFYSGGTTKVADGYIVWDGANDITPTDNEDLEQLKSDVADHLHRTDLTSVIPSFIRLAETKLSRDLEIPLLEDTDTLTTSIGVSYVTVPERFLQAIEVSISLSGQYQTLHRLSNRAIENAVQSNAIPAYYRIGNGRIEFDCPADAAYTIKLHYYKSLDLNADGSNELLSKYYDVYLYAVLTEAFRYLRDAEMAAYYGGLTAAVVDDAKLKESKDVGYSLAVSDVSGLFTGQAYDVRTG